MVQRARRGFSHCAACAGLHLLHPRLLPRAHCVPGMEGRAGLQPRRHTRPVAAAPCNAVPLAAAKPAAAAVHLRQQLPAPAAAATAVGAVAADTAAACRTVQQSPVVVVSRTLYIRCAAGSGTESQHTLYTIKSWLLHASCIMRIGSTQREQRLACWCLHAPYGKHSHDSACCLTVGFLYYKYWDNYRRVLPLHAAPRPVGEQHVVHSSRVVQPLTSESGACFAWPGGPSCPACHLQAELQLVACCCACLLGSAINACEWHALVWLVLRQTGLCNSQLVARLLCWCSCCVLGAAADHCL